MKSKMYEYVRIFKERSDFGNIVIFSVMNVGFSASPLANPIRNGYNNTIKNVDQE